MRNIFFCCLLVAMLTGCGSVKVNIEADKSVDFSKLATFSWLQTDEAPGKDVRVNNPEVVTLVRSAVEKQLRAMGYEKKEGAGADFLVTWFGAIENMVKVQSIDHFYTSYGYGAVASSMPLKSREGEQVTQYEEGTIIIDFLIPGNHKVFWRGIGTNRLLKGMNRADAELYIGRIVRQILKSFPPRNH